MSDIIKAPGLADTQPRLLTPVRLSGRQRTANLPTDRPPRIFFSVGEPSGDTHGANLIRHLREARPEIECVGYGGPMMQQAGCRIHEDLTALAIMWFAHVFTNIHRFWGLASRADRYFRHHKPDAVVLIDYPGFNWWIAGRAKAHGIPVYYYSAPQIWGWAGWRIKKMRRLVDHILCCLPFEEPWYKERGCDATFVGHPFFDEVQRHPYDTAFIDHEKSRPGRRVTILPGSRTQEVTANFPAFLKAARRIHEQVPDARFSVAAFKPKHAAMVREMIGRDSELPIEVHTSRTPELMVAADACMATSGSVSLELLHHTKPTVIHYRISPFAFRVQSWFRKVKYITLVNLLVADELTPADFDPLAEFDPNGPEADEVLFPEYLTCQDRSADVAAHVVEWLTNEAARQQCVQRLKALKQRVAHGGSSQRAAQYILETLDGGGTSRQSPSIDSPDERISAA